MGTKVVNLYLSRTVKEAQELKENALKEAEAYKTQKAKEVTERINTESEKITSAQNEKTTVLEKYLKKNILSGRMRYLIILSLRSRAKILRERG